MADILPFQNREAREAAEEQERKAALERQAKLQEAGEVSVAMEKASQGEGVKFKPGYPSGELAESAGNIIHAENRFGNDKTEASLLEREPGRVLSLEEQRLEINKLIGNVEKIKPHELGDKLRSATETLGDQIDKAA